MHPETSTPCATLKAVSQSVASTQLWKSPSMPITLYAHRLSQPCRAVEISLRELSVDYDFHEVGFAGGETRTPWYAEINAFQTVPALAVTQGGRWERARTRRKPDGYIVILVYIKYILHFRQLAVFAQVDDSGSRELFSVSHHPPKFSFCTRNVFIILYFSNQIFHFQTHFISGSDYTSFVQVKYFN